MAFSSGKSKTKSFLLRVLRLVELRELHRVEQLSDLLFRENLPFADDLENALAAPIGLAGELGRLLVSEHRIERGDDTDGGFHVAVEHFLVDGDAVDAALAERL